MSLFDVGLATATTGVASLKGTMDRKTPRHRLEARVPPKPAERTPPPARPEGWWGTLKALYGEINKDRVLAVAAGVAFYGLLAIFPAVTAFVSLYGLFNDRAQVVNDIASLSSVVPEGAMSIISDQMARIAGGDTSTLSLAAIAALAIALWSANSGMKAMLDALNVAYGVTEKRSFLKLNLQSLFFTLGGLVFLILMISAVAIVPAIIAFLSLGTAAEWLIWAGRWPAMLIILGLALAVLYRFGPNLENPKWRWISPGSALAAVGLVALSMLFSWYAANFGKFNETYGSLGAVIAFLTWSWLGATVVLIGAELNAILDQTAPPGEERTSA